MLLRHHEEKTVSRSIKEMAREGIGETILKKLIIFPKYGSAEEG
jgi:hypothetical protein